MNYIIQQLLLILPLSVFSKVLESADATPALTTQYAKPYITSETSKFGAHIEGTSVNWKGEVFATGFDTDNTLLNSIGKITTPQEIFFRDDSLQTHFNGVRFRSNKEAFAADVAGHRVVKMNIDKNGNVSKTENFCSNSTMIQPNDIAITSDGVVFTSGSKFAATTTNQSGDIWVCEAGKPARLLLVLGMTNGIEISKDNDYLFVSESYYNNSISTSQKIWKFKINSDYSLTNKELFYDFQKNLKTSKLADIDGMRMDVKGNLYVTRNGDGEVIVLNNKGQITSKIILNFSNPTNLEFGGFNGRDLYIVGRCGMDTPFGEGKGCVDKLNVTYQGRAFSNIQSAFFIH
jgi:sugar lactone lactonase YvrE